VNIVRMFPDPLPNHETALMPWSVGLTLTLGPPKIKNSRCDNKIEEKMA
jgi:hypothetical protein